MDVAFSFSPRLQQGFDGSAFVNVSSDELPPLFLAVSNGVIGKFRCVDQGVEIGACARCVQSGFSQQLRLWVMTERNDLDVHEDEASVSWISGSHQEANLRWQSIQPGREWLG